MISRKEFKKEDLLLYAVTDRTWLNGRTLESVVRESLDGGATFIQLREKNMDDDEFIAEARTIKKLCEEYKVPFVINDNVNVALAVDADGIHVGQSDMEAGNVREKVGPDKIVGVSAQTVEQAILAEKRGADYLGVGAVFPTGSKDDADDVSHETLKAICEAVAIPVVAIGGIGKNNVSELTGSGIDGIAVISAIFAQDNIRKATEELKAKTIDMVDFETVDSAIADLNLGDGSGKNGSICFVDTKAEKVDVKRNKSDSLSNIISNHDIKGAIFDMDGVVLDSMVIWNDLGERYLRNLGIEPEEGLKEKFFSMTLRESAAYLVSHYGLKKTGDEIKSEFKQMLEDFYFYEVAEKAGSGAVIRYLKEKGIPVVAATASPKVHVSRALERIGLLKYFNGVITTDEIGKGKTEPDIYLKAAEMMGTAPANTLIFEDAVYCVETGNRAGFVTVGVFDERGERDQKKLESIAKYYIKDYMELLSKKTALTIAGSDSSGGAGIQADLKTMIANGVYGMSAITALTAQNTTGVRSIMNVTPEFLADEIDSVFEDIRPDAIKIGMVSDKELIKVIAKKLREYKAENIVVDPVMVATSGARLISLDAIETLKNELFPLATVLTPNIPEAMEISGRKIESADDMVEVATEISKQYNCAVLLKGGHSLNDANDLLYFDGEYKWFSGKKIENPNTHGTGCTLSSAITSNLAKDYSLDEAVKKAKEYISGALGAMLDLGEGAGPMDHGFAIENEFSK